MYCPNCGKNLDSESKFCTSCGYNLLRNSVNNIFSNEVIDLTNTENKDIPTSKRHKGMIISVICTAIGWIIFILFLSLVGNFLDDSFSKGPSFYFNYKAPVGLVTSIIAICSVPIGIIGTIIISIIKKKANITQKPKKGLFPYYCVVACFISALSVSFSCSSIIAEDMGPFVQLISFFILSATITVYIILGIIMANECQDKEMFALLKAYFISFLPAFLLGFLFAKVFALFAIVFIIILVCTITAFGNGGVIVFHRK